MTTSAPADRRAVPRLLCALVLLTVPAYCLWQALELLFHLFGESATAAERAQAARWTAGAVGSALVSSLTGLALSTGRRGASVGFGLGLALAIALAVATADSLREVVPTPPRDDRPVACQERSGGDADCPGG